MGFFKDFFSKKDGSYKTYYSNGQLREESSYTSGKKDGHWKTFDQNGVLTSLKIYSFGRLIESTKNRDLLDSYNQGQREFESLLNEEVELTDPLGRPDEWYQSKNPSTNEELEKEDSESGEENILQDVSRMKKIIEEETGSPPKVIEEGGLTTFLFNKGDKEEKTPTEPIREGSVKDLYWGQKDDGTYTLTVYKDGKLHEIWEHQDLETLNTMKEGFVQGFYENGQPKWRGNYKNGVRSGPLETFYENGQLQTRGQLKNRKKEGFFEYFYENGQPKQRGNHKNGEIEGLYEWFYENGELSLRGNYKNGKLDGLLEKFDENGNLVQNVKYKDGELIE